MGCFKANAEKENSSQFLTLHQLHSHGEVGAQWFLPGFFETNQPWGAGRCNLGKSRAAHWHGMHEGNLCGMSLPVCQGGCRTANSKSDLLQIFPFYFLQQLLRASPVNGTVRFYGRKGCEDMNYLHPNLAGKELQFSGCDSSQGLREGSVMIYSCHCYCLGSSLVLLRLN